jgi:HK97 gp10 family phage protein
MSGFSFDFSALNQFSRDLDKIAQGIAKNERAAVRAAGQAYQHDVQVLAPVDTGQYRASIRVEMEVEGIRQVALIGTPMPQACRLEYGFFGMTDVLGRTFHQYPRPHWRPPFDQNKEKYGAIMMAMLQGTQAGIFGNYAAEKREEWNISTRIAASLRPDLTGGT